MLTKGPKAKPRTSNEVPSVVTSGETWKSSAVGIVALPKMLEAKVTDSALLALLEDAGH